MWGGRGIVWEAQCRIACGLMSATDLHFQNCMEYSRFVDSMVARTFPRERWGHQAHLAIGLWHVLRYSPTDSLLRLRGIIESYQEALGISNGRVRGYHETLTRFYIWAIADFAAGMSGTDSRISAVFRSLRASPLADRDFPFIYYSPEVLHCPIARDLWVAPDLKPLDLRRAPEFREIVP